MNNFQASHQAFSGLLLPVANFGQPFDGTYKVAIKGTRTDTGASVGGTFTLTSNNGVFGGTVAGIGIFSGSITSAGEVTLTVLKNSESLGIPCDDMIFSGVAVASSGVVTISGTWSSPSGAPDPLAPPGGTCPGFSGIWTGFSGTSTPITNVAQFNGNYHASTVESGTGIMQPFTFTATNGVIAGATLAELFPAQYPQLAPSP